MAGTSEGRLGPLPSTQSKKRSRTPGSLARFEFCVLASFREGKYYETWLGASYLGVFGGIKSLTAEAQRKAPEIADNCKTSGCFLRASQFSMRFLRLPLRALRLNAFDGAQRRKRRSAATKAKKTTEITPFIVKKAALSLERSRGETSVCS